MDEFRVKCRIKHLSQSYIDTILPPIELLMAEPRERIPGIRMFPKGHPEHQGFRLVEYDPMGPFHEQTSQDCMDAEVWISHIPEYFSFVKKCWAQRFRPMFNWKDGKLYLYDVDKYKSFKGEVRNVWKEFLTSEILVDLRKE